MFDLLGLTVSKDLIREWTSFFAIRVVLMDFTPTGYMARVSVDAIICAMEHSSTARRETPVRKEEIRFDPFLIFAPNVIHRSGVKIPAILVALVYSKRAGDRLQSRGDVMCNMGITHPNKIKIRRGGKRGRRNSFSSSPQNGLLRVFSWGRSYSPTKSVLI